MRNRSAQSPSPIDVLRCTTERSMAITTAPPIHPATYLKVQLTRDPRLDKSTQLDPLASKMTLPTAPNTATSHSLERAPPQLVPLPQPQEPVTDDRCGGAETPSRPILPLLLERRSRAKSTQSIPIRRPACQNPKPCECRKNSTRWSPFRKMPARYLRFRLPVP